MQTETINTNSTAEIMAEIALNPKAFIDELAELDEFVKARKKAATEWIRTNGPLISTHAVFKRPEPTERFAAAFIEQEPVVEDEEEAE